MHLWIDNTGLYSAAQSLLGYSQGEDDTKGLLQLATLLIFAETLFVNGFEQEEVSGRTKGVKHHLEHLGLDEMGLSIVPSSKEEYARACEVAASRCADDLYWAFNPGKQEPSAPRQLSIQDLVIHVDTSLPLGLSIQDSVIHGHADIPSRAEKALIAKIGDLVHESDKRIEEIKQSALDKRASGAIEYMFAASPELRDSVSKLGYSKLDSRTFIYRLNAFLRYYLNDALAEKMSIYYVPAVARSRYVRRQNNFLIKKLSNKMDDAVSQLRGEPLNVPSVQSVLINRAKGKPEGIIRAALELREEATELRKWLYDLAQKHDLRESKGRAEAFGQIDKLSIAIEQCLRPAKAPRLSKALEFSAVVSLVIPTAEAPIPLQPGVELGVSVDEFCKWVKYRWGDRRIAILTEISKEASFPDAEHELYMELHRECSKKVSI